MSDQQEDYDDDQTCQERPEALAPAERRAGVVDQMQPQRPDEIDGSIVQRMERPPLGELIEADDSQPDACGRRPPARKAGAGNHRRPSPPALNSTRWDAHGMISSRSLGMFFPDFTQTP